MRAISEMSCSDFIQIILSAISLLVGAVSVGIALFIYEQQVKDSNDEMSKRQYNERARFRIVDNNIACDYEREFSLV